MAPHIRPIPANIIMIIIILYSVHVLLLVGPIYGVTHALLQFLDADDDVMMVVNKVESRECESGGRKRKDASPAESEEETETCNLSRTEHCF